MKLASLIFSVSHSTCEEREDGEGERGRDVRGRGWGARRSGGDNGERRGSEGGMV